MMPAQHVAGAGGRKQWRAVGIDRGPAVRRGDHRVRALCRMSIAFDRAAARRARSTFDRFFVGGDAGKKPRELALMRRQDQSPAHPAAALP